MKLSFGFTRGLMYVFIVMIGLAIPIGLLQAAPDGGVVGNGTPGSCTESALTIALAGGGNVTFNCGGPTTISIASVKTITQNTSINGGDSITLTGGLSTPLLHVNVTASLALSNITLMNAYNTNSSGAAIWSAGPLTLTHVTIKNSQTIPQYCGGALLVAGETQINNSRFENNVAGLGGGAICVRSQPGTKVQIANTSFFGNQATNPASGLGGALYIEYGTAVVRDSIFLLNNGVLGGAIQVNDAAQLTMASGSLSSNTAVYGGGIFVGLGARADILGPTIPSFFTSNAASDSGGAIFNNGGTVQISNGTFSANSAAPDVVLSGYGGAIANLGVMTITTTYFGLNQGRFGGAVFVGNNGSGANATIEHSAFYQNTATQLGGGLYTNIPTTTVTISNSVFHGNTTGGNGGGLARFNSNLKIFNSSFTNNTAAAGGGLALSAGPSPSSGPYVRVQSVTVSHNTATGNVGGGVYNTGLAELYFTTIVSNTNGVYSALGANTRFRSSVLHNPGSFNCDGDGTAQISNDAANHVTDNSCGPQFTVVGGDPLLGPLQSDGSGTTSYHLPLAGSPLINTGYSNCPERDQRGALRPDACDIGAVEFGGLLPRVYLPVVVK
jgi:predicted outer membrane repeat protein